MSTEFFDTLRDVLKADAKVWQQSGLLEVVTLMRASALFPDIDSCHVFIVSLYLFDSVPRQAESSHALVSQRVRQPCDFNMVKIHFGTLY